MVVGAAAYTIVKPFLAQTLGREVETTEQEAAHF
jgi:hypothetical protein